MIQKLLLAGFIGMMLSGSAGAQARYGTNPEKGHELTLKVFNLTALTNHTKPVSKLWAEKNAAFVGHPDAGRTSEWSPAAGAVEVLSKRTVDTRYYVDEQHPGKFYSQSAVGALHYKSGGQWVAIDTRLEAAGSGVYAAARQWNPVELNVAAHNSAIATAAGKIRFNHWRLYGENGTGKTLIGEADWSHYTVGDEGARVRDIFPGMDAELIVSRGSVKTNFIVRSAQAYIAYNNLVFEDQFNGGGDAAFAAKGEPVSGATDFLVGGKPMLHVERGVMYPTLIKDKQQIRFLTYKTDVQKLQFSVSVAYLQAFPGGVTIDPQVTSTNTLLQASITGSGYTSTCWASGCTYILPLTFPAGTTCTDVLHSFSYSAINPCWLYDGSYWFNLGACRNPVPSNYFWFANTAGPGTAGATNASIGSLAACAPAPSCTVQTANLTFTLSRCYNSGTGCSGTCVGAASPLVITVVGNTVEYVNAVAPITLSATSVCAGGSINASTSVQNGVAPFTYIWSTSPTYSPVVGTGAAPSITFPTAGTYTLYLKVTDGCGNIITATSGAITVNPAPAQPGAITGSTSPCVGSTQAYSVAAVTGATSYTWTYPSGWSGSSTSNSISTVVGATAGNVTVTATNSCGTSAAQTLAVTPITVPSAPGTISGNTPVCAGSSNTYSIGTVAGATSYTWSVTGTGWSSTPSTTTSFNTTAGTGNGTISVTANNTCGPSAAATLPVVVNPVVTPTVTISQSTLPPVCANTPVTFTVTGSTNAGTTPSYQWFVNTTPSGTNSPTFTGSSWNNGDVVKVIMTSNAACTSPATATSNTIAVVVTSAPAQPGAITGSTATCNGAATTYSITAVPGATTYTWVVPTGWVVNSGAGTTSINVTPNGTGGNITVTAGNACGTSSAATLTISSGSTPATPGTITGNTPVCAGSANTYSIGAVAGATSYTWSATGTGWSSTASTATSFNTTAGTGNGTISVTASNSCGTSAASTLPVTVNPVLTPTVTIAQSTLPPICANTPVTFSVTGSTNAGTTPSYQWFVNTTPSGTNSTTFTGSSWSNGDVVKVIMTSNAVCVSPVAATSNTITVPVTSAPAQPGAIAGSTATCNGAATTYSITAVPGATTYTWTVPTGWVINSGAGATSLNVTPNANSGNVTVTAGNSCGTSSAATLAIISGTGPAAPGAITGNTPVCAGSANTYSIAAVSGATSYTWSATGTGWSSTASTTTSFNTTAGTGNGTISVTASNSCGTSAATTLPVTVNLVVTPTVTIAQSTLPPICANTPVTFTVTGSTNAGTTPSYQWFVNTTPSGTNSTTFTGSTWNNGDVVKVIMTSNNACASPITATSNTITVPVTSAPAQPGAIAGSTSPCATTSQVYSITAVSGATTYTWSAPTGWTIATGQGTTSVTMTVGATSGNVGVTAGNSCGTSTQQTLAINVNATPVTPGTIAGNSVVCSGAAGNYSITAVPGATTYTWTVPTGWVINSGAGTTTINVTPNATSGNVTVTAANTCGTSSAATLAVTSGATPPTPGAITGNTPVCQGSTNTYTVPTATGVTYNWVVPSGWTFTQTTNSISAVAGSTGGNITVSATNGCGTSGLSSYAVAVNPPLTPAVSISANPAGTICTGASVTFTPTPTNGGASPTYQWKKNGTTVATGATYTDATLANGDVITAVLTSNAPCVSPTTATSAGITMSVNATPVAPSSITGAVSICGNSTNTYTASTVSNATGYTWSVPTGWTNSSTGNSLTTTANNTSGTITVTANNACGTSPITSLAVTVTPPLTPSVTIAATPGNVICAGTSVTFTPTPVNGGTTPAYQWKKNGTNVATGGTYTTTGLANGDVITVVMTGSLTCATAPTATSPGITMTVNTVPAAPGAISGGTIVCSGSPQQYSVSPVATATSYTWTLPASWTGSNTTASILATIGASSGSVTVTANNQCGPSSPASLAVTVITTPPTPGAISGNAAPCANTLQTYSVSAVSGATSYNWTLPAGWSGGSSTASITATSGTGGGTITVTSVNACGPSAPATLAVNPVNIPPTPGAISGGNTPCSNTAQTYTVAAVPGATSYTWYAPTGWTGSSATNTVTFTTTTGSGNVQVAANGTCGTSGLSTLAVSPVLSVTPTVVITTPSTSICQNSLTTFTANPANGGTTPQYQWKKNGVAVGPNSGTYSDQFLNNGDQITVTMTSNAPCATTTIVTSSPVIITLIPTVTPGINVNTVPPTVLCAGTPLIFTSNINSGGTNPQYQWFLNNNAIAGATNPTYTNSNFANGDTISVRLTSNVACPSAGVVMSNKIGLTVQANLVPTVSVTANPGTTVGSGTLVTFTANVANAGTAPAFQWYKNGTAIAFATNNTYTTSGLHNDDMISVRLTSNAPCASPNIVSAIPLHMNISTGVTTVNSGWTGSLAIYPNPTTGHFTISADWGSGHSGERVKIDIVNTLGQKIYTSEIVPNTAQWSVPVWLGEEVANGVYQLRIRTENMSTVRGIMIQR